MFSRIRKFPIKSVTHSPQRPISILVPVSFFTNPLGNFNLLKNTKSKPLIPPETYLVNYKRAYKENLAIQKGMLGILRKYTGIDKLKVKDLNIRLTTEDLNIMQLLLEKSSSRRYEMRLIKGLLSHRGCEIDEEGNLSPKLLTATTAPQPGYRAGPA
jgi:hypothetical protein